MPHDTPLIATIVAGLGLAFIFGVVAHRLRLPPLIGYLLAGVMVGPNTPGFVADQKLGNELAEIGVILLMFGVGLHFSLKDLLSVRAIAIPGAIAQIALATLLGGIIAWWLDWTLGAALVFGLALSVASTVVLLRAMQERRLLETERGRIAVGWLIVEDLVTVIVLVMLPAFAPLLAGNAAAAPHDPIADYLDLGLAGVLALTVLKAVAFVAFMLIVGRRMVPWILHYVAHTGSRELFRLAVLAIALGVAFGAAKLFGVSLALGAFFAGMIMSESELSHRAAEESLPLRDAFSVLFFVSVGMLFDPWFVVNDFVAVLATVAVIVIGKSFAAFAIVRLFRHPTGTALLISASLAQIGEFSFILANLGVGLDLLPERGRDLVLAGAIISILLNPLSFAAVSRIRAHLEGKSSAAPSPAPDTETREPLIETQLTGHTVLVGYGRSGQIVADALRADQTPLLVIEDAADGVAKLKMLGIETLVGNGADEEVLAAANLKAAKRLIVTIPNIFESGQIAMQARAANPGLTIIARAQSEAEVQHLTELGANVVIVAETEVAKSILAALRGAEATSPPPPSAP